MCTVPCRRDDVREANRQIHEGSEEVEEVGVVVHGNCHELVEDFVHETHEDHENEGDCQVPIPLEVCRRLQVALL